MEGLYDQHEFMFNDFDIDFTTSYNAKDFMDL